MDELTVSVFMITYNHEKYISQAIEGVLMQQTSFKYEIVIGEDCSTDSTREIVVSYKKKYSDRIKLLLHDVNIGAINNHIVTFNACNGKYIAFCEGDDYWTDPYKLQKQVDFLEKNPKANFCFHRVKSSIQKEKKIITISKGEKINKKHFTKDYLMGIPTATLSFVTRNNFKFPKWFNTVYAGDKFTMLLSSLKGYGFCLPEYMGVYRVHESNITHTFAKKKPTQELKNNLRNLDYFDEYTNYEFHKTIIKAKKKIMLSFKINLADRRSEYLILKTIFFFRYERKNYFAIKEFIRSFILTLIKS